jgi:hypothetical protein
MVMVVALVAFQLSVTLCGGVIVLVFAEKIRVGGAELLCAGLPLAHKHKGPRGHKLGYQSQFCGEVFRLS